jgi:hypothetical protein
MLPKIVVYLTIAKARGTSVSTHQQNPIFLILSRDVCNRRRSFELECLRAKSGPFLAFQKYVMPRSVTKCLSLAFLRALGEL